MHEISVIPILKLWVRVQVRNTARDQAGNRIRIKTRTWDWYSSYSFEALNLGTSIRVEDLKNSVPNQGVRVILKDSTALILKIINLEASCTFIYFVVSIRTSESYDCWILGSKGSHSNCWTFL